LVNHRFFDKGNLVNDSAFKREKILVNDGCVPALGRVHHNVTNFSYVLPIVRGEDLITILPNDPVVFPNVNRLPISHLPAATFLNHIHSLMETLPHIAGVPPLMRVHNVSGGVILGF
jgi:hypothetical protein